MLKRQKPQRLVRRGTQLLVGLVICGVAIAFILQAGIGAAPWDVLTAGLINHLPLSFGVVTVMVSAVVLLLWIPLRERPGVGTVLNALLVGPSADLGFFLLPEPQTLWLQALFFAIGLLLFGVGSGLYIGAGFGSGPRDGLMTGLHRKFGIPIWVARTGLEVTVVVIGWIMGGPAGVGTVVFTFAIGPLCQVFIKQFTVPLRPADLTVSGTITGPIDIIGEVNDDPDGSPDSAATGG